MGMQGKDAIVRNLNVWNSIASALLWAEFVGMTVIV
jgi:hypothetical protein